MRLYLSGGLILFLGFLVGIPVIAALASGPPTHFQQVSPAVRGHVGGPPIRTNLERQYPDVPEGGYPTSSAQYGFNYQYGQCTWWVSYNIPVSWSGDAGEWFAKATTAGRPTSTAPAYHSIVVYRPSRQYSAYGHVGVVVGVSPSSFRVSEMNLIDGGAGTGAVDQRDSPWPDPLVEGFIAWQ